MVKIVKEIVNYEINQDPHLDQKINYNKIKVYLQTLISSRVNKN